MNPCCFESRLSYFSEYREEGILFLLWSSIFMWRAGALPCVSVGKYRGETEGTAVSQERGWKRSFLCSFFSTARRTNQEALPQLSGLLACRYGRRRGGCGTRSAQTVLALFPPSPLRLRRPIKAESGIVTVAVFFNPSVLRTPPLYFALQNTGEEDNSFLYFSFLGGPDEQGRD